MKKLLISLLVMSVSVGVYAQSSQAANVQEIHDQWCKELVMLDSREAAEQSFFAGVSNLNKKTIRECLKSVVTEHDYGILLDCVKKVHNSFYDDMKNLDVTTMTVEEHFAMRISSPALLEVSLAVNLHQANFERKNAALLFFLLAKHLMYLSFNRGMTDGLCDIKPGQVNEDLGAVLDFCHTVFDVAQQSIADNRDMFTQIIK